ncbi:MAG TPA: hypothetical protein VFJ82_14255 [Longimicrobium sp.]|nr:hypothetical protein [Longimicrobium sp.]
MKTIVPVLVLAAACQPASGPAAPPVPVAPPEGQEPARFAPLEHAHGQGALFIARLRADSGRTASSPTGTGAFVLEARGRDATLRYDLTYDGVPGGASAVTLRNAGEGGSGAVLHVICGAAGAERCPPRSGATLAGAWTSAGGLTPERVRELAARRVYVEVQGGRTLRGQLLQQPFMATHVDFTARFGAQGAVGTPLAAAGPTGTGAFHLIHFGNGTEELQFEVTVVGAGQVTGSTFVTADSLRVAPAERAGLSLLTPAGESRRVGNTLSGRIRSTAPAATVFALRGADVRAQMLAGAASVRVTATAAPPLTAALVPVP